MWDHECHGYFHSYFPQCSTIALRQGTHQNDGCLWFEWPDVKGVPQKQLQRAYKVCRRWPARCRLHCVPAGHQRLPKHNILAELLHHRCWNDSWNRKASSRIFSCFQLELIHQKRTEAIEGFIHCQLGRADAETVCLILIHLRCQIPQLHHSSQLRLLQQIRTWWNHCYAYNRRAPKVY